MPSHLRRFAASPPTAALPWHRRLLRWVRDAAVVLAVLTGAHAWQTRDVPSGQAPAFNATAALPVDRTQSLSLAQWRAAHPGRAVALHFWADWCPVCKLEQSNITRVAADWPVLTIATQSGTAPAVHAVQAQRSLNWATVADPQGELLARYGLKAVPAFVVITADGRLASTSVGYTSELGMRLRLWWAEFW